MNFLVTGTNGFIGSNLLKGLKNAYPFATINTFNEEDVLGSPHKLMEYVGQADSIFHVGAISSTDCNDINKIMRLNCEFTKNLIDFAYHYNTKLIFSSSASVYGNNNSGPDSLYSWTKKISEDYGFAKLKKGKFIALRYFNVYGPGENHKGHMASVANQAYFFNKKNPDKPFQLFPMSPTRDFVYIDDIVSANIYANKNILGNDFYDVGSGESNTFENVLRLLNVNYEYLDAKFIPSWYQFNTCASKVRFLPNWKPKFNLERGMSEYKKYLELI